jgi:hypothetical protein
MGHINIVIAEPEIPHLLCYVDCEYHQNSLQRFEWYSIATAVNQTSDVHIMG